MHILTTSTTRRATPIVLISTSSAVHHQARSRRSSTCGLTASTPRDAIDAPFPRRNRNDALDQVQLLRDELAYLKKNPAETPDDVVAAQRQAVKAFDNYFALAPADDIRAARAIVGPAGPGTRN